MQESKQETRKTERKPKLRSLGQDTKYDFNYNPDILETVPNPHPDNDYFIKFNCPEFTSLCPITGQPDFATIYISYIPNNKIVESKSLKLYLFSFRNHGGFHEDCVNVIAKDLIAILEPRYLEVWGKFLPRGGLSIDPYVNYGNGKRFAKMAKKRLLLHDIYPEIITNR
ncbi:NADPH-dependent 7-cyano-7-deazaguanine reductase QueF [Helicobacter muridarum]|uniref:NADPH-dependent 7-cyano-7-deazaguanine reductase n=1 Tax=Helicobacter muridarum TaxID=216 RepID=A0A099TWS1_9HELI|nr:preQ(1) synthase [Helicobacter muridarum]TLE00651.1 NADPH-dependent 7-cyano-7-deazaguanine reductase QueF [Helicobacter muridarum]STQ85670.1 NADPH-dependent 7-cyano-7-deazaguanine reductase QueF [Helicobacter muridarum]